MQSSRLLLALTLVSLSSGAPIPDFISSLNVGNTVGTDSASSTGRGGFWGGVSGAMAAFGNGIQNVFRKGTMQSLPGTTIGVGNALNTTAAGASGKANMFGNTGSIGGGGNGVQNILDGNTSPNRQVMPGVPQPQQQVVQQNQQQPQTSMPGIPSAGNRGVVVGDLKVGDALNAKTTMSTGSSGTAGGSGSMTTVGNGVGNGVQLSDAFSNGMSSSGLISNPAGNGNLVASGQVGATAGGNTVASTGNGHGFGSSGSSSNIGNSVGNVVTN